MFVRVFRNIVRLCLRKPPGHVASRTVIYVTQGQRPTFHSAGIPKYTSLDEWVHVYITSHVHELYAAACLDFLYSGTSALFDGNLCLVNTGFGLPKIVLKIIVGEFVRDRLTIFLLDGSLDACVYGGITEKRC